MSDAIAVGLIVSGIFVTLVGITLMIQRAFTYVRNKRRREAERELKRQETFKAWTEKMKTLDPNSFEFEIAIIERLGEI